MMSDCILCEAKGTVTESIQVETFDVGTKDANDGKHFVVKANVIVMSCSECCEEWTDYRSEEIRNKAIEEQTPYRISEDGMRMIWTGEAV
jgi:hypothetical protein